MDGVPADPWAELEQAEAAADENGQAVVQTEARIEQLAEEGERNALRDEWQRLRDLYGQQDELEMAVARARAEAEAAGDGPSERAAA